MKIKQDQLMWIAIIAIAVIIILPYLGIIPNFEIVDSDISMAEIGAVPRNGSIDVFQYLISSDSTISFTYLNTTYNYPDGKVLYLLDNDTTLLDDIPQMTQDTHTIIKYQLNTRLNENNEKLIVVQKGSKTFFNVIQMVEVEVPGPTVYINQTVYVNRTVNQTITVEKEVQAKLSFIQQYGLAGLIFIIMGVIIIYLIWKRTR